MNRGELVKTKHDGLTVSFHSAEFFTNPYATYDLLRDVDPVHWSDELGRWVLTRYEDAIRVLRGTQFTSRPEQHRAVFRYGLSYLDGDDHARIRKLLNPYFTREAGRRKLELIEDVTDGFVQRMLHAREFDFVTGFAKPFAIRLITRILDLPVADGPLLDRWTTDVVNAEGIVATAPARLRSLEAYRAASRYIEQFLDDMPAGGEGSLNAALLRAHRDRVLTTHELIDTVMELIMGTLETTPALLSSGLLTLLRNPDGAGKLTEAPERLGNAVEEMLRYEPPFQLANRIARVDVRIGGRTIRAGDRLLQFLGAANRDPAQFPDPARFDVERPNAFKHLAFGGGLHHCTGSAVARQAVGMVFRKLLPHHSRIQCSAHAENWQSQSLMLRKLESLPITVRAPHGHNGSAQ
jgi:cytochrome P450